MKVLLLNILMLFSVLQHLNSQDSVQYRIIFIGNAGALTAGQELIINDAVKHSVPNKTLALFLGNNIYPSGMQPGDKKKNKLSKEILTSQYIRFSKKRHSGIFYSGYSGLG